MRILVTGSTGFIGSKVVSFLSAQGHEVLRLVRPQSCGQAAPQDITWDPAQQTIEADKLEGLDAVIHLAGENLGARRWTTAQKRRIRSSRVEGTAFLARTLAQLERRPGVLLSASAVGFYGDRGDEVLSEDSPCGSGFVAQMCRDWEAACAPAEAAGIRVVFLRMGILLAREYGVLAALLPSHRLGAGPVLGTGKQFTPWVSVRDTLRAIEWALSHEEVAGPLNVVAPEVAPQAVFAQTLSRVLGKKARLRLPGIILRLVKGEMADPLLLDSNRVIPARLLSAGFSFSEPSLEGTMRNALSAGSWTAQEQQPEDLLPESAGVARAA